MTTLRYGSKGSEVMTLQTILGNLDVDGIFGKKTKAAVIAFQTANNLNPDGIVGKLTWAALLGETTPADTNPRGFVQPVDYKQYDKRWATKMYSSHNDKSQTMKSSGCGPTAMADIVAEWWDAEITPYDLAVKSMDWRTRTYNSGTSSTFFRKIANLYKASKYQTASSIEAVKSCLDEGGYVIVCFGAGTKGKAGYQKWTKGGHYCCIWGYDDDVFFINDPASSSASRAKGTRTEILNTRKGFYLFYK